MKLPNPERAVIDTRKIFDYCLNFEHENGRHHAEGFATILGIRKENASLLVEALRQAAKSDARLVKETEYGTLYAIDFEMTTGHGNAWVRTGWIVRHEENFARLTTCYIPRK